MKVMTPDEYQEHFSGNPYVGKSPIEKAAIAVVRHLLGDDVPDDEHECCVAVIKRELKRELENASGITMTEEQAKGWVKCLRFLGVKE